MGDHGIGTVFPNPCYLVQTHVPPRQAPNEAILKETASKPIDPARVYSILKNQGRIEMDIKKIIYIL